MKAVFVDTVGFLALWNAQDPYHEAAARALTELARTGADLLTTAFILLECGNAASRTKFRKDVVEVRDHLDAQGKLIVPTDEDCKTAWSEYERGIAGEAGIVDHVAFLVMRRLGIEDAFPNDRHFRIAGFNTLF